MARSSGPKKSGSKSDASAQDTGAVGVNPAASPIGTDWKTLEAELEAQSSGAVTTRLSRPGDKRYDDAINALRHDKVEPRFVQEWAQLTIKPLKARAAELNLTPQALELREMQELDAMKGLAARAHHSLTVSKASALKGELLGDKGLAPLTRDSKLAEVQAIARAAHEAYRTALEDSPEAFLAAHSADLNSYKRQYQRGRIIQVPYVKEKKAEIADHLRKARMVFVSGETGTGKTEVARIVAQEVSGHDALVVRGYAGMGKAELYGHMALTDSVEQRAENARAAIEQAEKLFCEKYPHASMKELRELTKAILTQGGVTTTEYILGAVYEAARDGKVVIIDEANYIPPELLASLNDIMTKRAGETISVQQDGVGPITVKEGFGIIFTGNLNPPTGPLAKRYIGRKEFDAAFVDRVPDVKYDRLPQVVQGQPDKTDFENKQLFVLAVIAALDYLPKNARERGTLEKLESRYGTLFLPGGSKEGLDLLWRFSQFAAVTQMAFHGEIATGHPHGFERSGSSAGYVPKVQLSNRGMMRVIEQWRDDGFQYELDFYIARDLFGRAKDPSDRAYLYQRGQKFGFFTSDGWDRRPDYSSEGIQRFSVAIPTNKGLDGKVTGNEAAPRDIVPAREVISSLWGAVPARKVWPDNERTEQEKRRQLAAEFDAMKAQLLALFEPSQREIEMLAEAAKFDADHDECMKRIEGPLKRLAEG